MDVKLNLSVVNIAQCTMIGGGKLETHLDFFLADGAVTLSRRVLSMGVNQLSHASGFAAAIITGLKGTVTLKNQRMSSLGKTVKAKSGILRRMATLLDMSLKTQIVGQMGKFISIGMSCRKSSEGRCEKVKTSTIRTATGETTAQKTLSFGFLDNLPGSASKMLPDGPLSGFLRPTLKQS